MSRRDPSTWWTTTLLAHYGPRDRTQYDVLQAIDSFDRGDSSARRYAPTLDQIAERARMSTSTLKVAVSALEAEGWLSVARGRGRGNTHHFRINRRRLERDAMAAVKEPVLGSFLEDEPDENSRPPALLGPENSRLTDVKQPVTGYTEWREREKTGETSSSAGANVAPEPTTDDDAAKALTGIRGLHPAADVRAKIAAAIEAGWTPATLNAHLGTQSWGSTDAPMRLLRTVLGDLPAAPTPIAEAEAVDWCGQCDSDGYRWVLNDDGSPARRCPRCNTAAPDYDPGWQMSILLGINGANDDLGDTEPATDPARHTSVTDLVPPWAASRRRTRPQRPTTEVRGSASAALALGTPRRRAGSQR